MIWIDGTATCPIGGVIRSIYIRFYKRTENVRAKRGGSEFNDSHLGGSVYAWHQHALPEKFLTLRVLLWLSDGGFEALRFSLLHE